MNIENAKKLLKEKDISITENRLEILMRLADHHHFHSISEIVNESNGKLNKKSVYNAIKLFICKGLAEAYTLGGVPKYALTDNLEGKSEIHVVSQDGVIKHLSIDQRIFDDIKKSVGEDEVSSISISVLLK
ncbi:MAG: hypothetical protein DSZ21_02315 [Tenericutes bacterium]|nr:MAG: hypothetical protein DSZ21_02315 [Mycoplasmatota bacterium]